MVRLNTSQTTTGPYARKRSSEALYFPGQMEGQPPRLSRGLTFTFNQEKPLLPYLTFLHYDIAQGSDGGSGLPGGV